MSKYFNGDKLSGYEDSPITYVHNNLEKFNKVIADLEAKLAEKEKEIEELKRKYELSCFTIGGLAGTTKKLNGENQQLKQQLHDLPKKIVEEIKDKIPEIGGMKCEIIIDDFLTLNTLLDTILKKYGANKNN